MSRSSAFHLTRAGNGNTTGLSPTRLPRNTSQPAIVPPRDNHNHNSSERNNEWNNNSNLTDLPLPLSRLRGISEGSLSSADEVINFSERPMTNREETDNFTAEIPAEEPNELLQFSNNNSSDAWRNMIFNLQSERNNYRMEQNNNRNNEEPSTSTSSSSVLHSFSQRLENIVNQSDAILANLRRSMELLIEPPNQQSTTAPTQEGSASPSSVARRIFILRRPSAFHTHNRLCVPRCSGTSRMSSSTSHCVPSSSTMRNPHRYTRNRHARHNMTHYDMVWRPFDEHSYPRDPDNQRPSPRSPPSMENPTVEFENTNNNTEETPPARSSTPAPFPTTDHNYPLSDPSTSDIPNPMDPIADHTYPRDPQNNANPNSPDYIAPLVSSLHSTISHISMQTNLLRRQVESIELIDRARFEIFQLQELRRMWEDVRRHMTFATNERRSNISNVRQMMAWTRISDPSPSSESAQSSTEHSTPSTPDITTPSTSRSSASSSNESRTQLNPGSSYSMARFRQNHIKKRLYWRRRAMRNEFNPRRNLRGQSYRATNRTAESLPGSRNEQNSSNLSEVTVSLMIRGLEQLLTQQSRLFGRRDTQNSPDRNSMERRVLSERVIQTRLRAARARLNRLSGFDSHASLSYLDEPVEYSSLGSRNDWVRYETRLKLSVYIEMLSRFVESHNAPIPPILGDQIKSLLELALLLTDLLLLQIMESIPASSGSILDPERETLSVRIDQMCTNLLQNQMHIRSVSLPRVLHSLRLTARYMVSSLRLAPGRIERNSAGFRSLRNYRREAMIDLNRQLRSLYQFSNYLNEPEAPASEPGPSTSTTQDNSMSHVSHLGDLLARLRNVRGRLEQFSQSAASGRFAQNSSSATELEPTRSTDESPSDRESESFEGFQTGERDYSLPESPGTLYRSSHVSLYPPDQSSSQSSPERATQPGSSRQWNVPTVQVNDVPVSETLTPSQLWHPRPWTQRYLSEIRPLSQATGLFRPRFLIPFYAGVNPFDADLEESQREPMAAYDGVMTATVSPNHRIQMWDISKCCIPSISNHEKNIVVSECKIHNDGSVDISKDGTLLVTLLPSGGYLNVTNRLGIYSINWETLGQCLYTTSFEQNAISVSLSPLSRHLIVGLASRRVTLLPSDRWTMARIFLLDDRKIKITGRGRLIVLRDLEQGRERDINFMSVNCIKWIPVSGQGIVFATNTGQLKVLT